MSEWIAFKDQEPAAGRRIIAWRRGYDWIENFSNSIPPRMSHWQPTPEPPPNPDPFEEWWGDPTCGWKAIAGYQVTKGEARVIFAAGLEAGRKEK